MSTLAADARSAPPRLAVTLLDPRERPAREGYVECIQPDREGGVTVSLLLDDGTQGSAWLSEVDADWLELRPGDIAGVAPAAPPVRSAARARAVGRRELRDALR